TVAEAFLATAATMHSGPQVSGAAGTTDEAAKKLEVFLAQHGLGSGDANAAADALLKLDDQLSAARARTTELNGKIAAMKAVGVDAAMGGGLPQEFESNAMAALRTQYLAIKRESDRAGAQLGPRNPERIALDTQLAGARDRIAAELRRITASLQATLKEAVQAEQGLAARRAQSGLDANGIATLRTLRDAARQAAAEARPGYSDDLRDATNGASVVTKAYAPLEPSWPSRLPVTLAGLLAGLAAGAGIGAVRGRRRTRAGDADENTGSMRQATGSFGEDRAPAAPAPAIENLISAVRRAPPAQEPIDAGGAEPVPTETAETPYPLEDTMYPVYADQMHAFAPRQPGDAPQQPFQPPVYAAPHPYGTQPAMPQMVQPYVYTPYAPAYLWQPQPPMPIQAGFYPYPQPAQPMSGYPQPARTEAAPAATAAADQASLEEIRASLREFREAVRELAESRTRRRYF
ncbi:MAG: succinoglycan biosynthesis protein exop, partial [Mesorhizobium sp.]